MAQPGVRKALAALLSIVVITGCAQDPGTGLPPHVEPADKYEQWLTSWADEADGYSREYFALVKLVRSGRVSLPDLRAASGGLRNRSEVLETKIREAGPLPDSAVTPPGYDRALFLALDDLLAVDAQLQGCSGDECARGTDDLLDVASATEDLVVLSSDVYRRPSSALRTKTLASALLTEADLGGDGHEDDSDPLDFLCDTEVVDQDVVPEPVEAMTTVVELKDGAVVVHGLQRWTPVADARRMFEAVRLRTIVCELAPTSTTEWESAVSDVPGLPVAAWQADIDGDRGESYTVLGVTALVDDTLVTTALIDVAERPSIGLVDDIVIKQAERLGAGPSLVLPTR